MLFKIKSVCITFASRTTAMTVWSSALTIHFACINASERPRRATVLTDKSKKILDIFDFSNFDKQEALSYIYRQRFENLIRGKRSKWNLKQSFLEPDVNFDDFRSVYNGLHNERASAKRSNNQKLEKRLNHDENQFEDEAFYVNEANALKPCRDQCVTFYLLRRKKGTESQKNCENCRKSTTELIRPEDKNTLEEEEEEDDDEKYKEEDERERRKKKRKKKRKRRRYWSKWSKWSPCSVTCGKGRRIRSRKCIAKFCPAGEIEMGEKTCQLPACSLLDKLFSLFK